MAYIKNISIKINDSVIVPTSSLIRVKGTIDGKKWDIACPPEHFVKALDQYAKANNINTSTASFFF